MGMKGDLKLPLVPSSSVLLPESFAIWLSPSVLTESLQRLVRLRSLLSRSHQPNYWFIWNYSISM